jgi:hypothetical protein
VRRGRRTLMKLRRYLGVGEREGRDTIPVPMAVPKGALGGPGDI